MAKKKAAPKKKTGNGKPSPKVTKDSKKKNGNGKGPKVIQDSKETTRGGGGRVMAVDVVEARQKSTREKFSNVRIINGKRKVFTFKPVEDYNSSFWMVIFCNIREATKRFMLYYHDLLTHNETSSVSKGRTVQPGEDEDEPKIDDIKMPDDRLTAALETLIFYNESRLRTIHQYLQHGQTFLQIIAWECEIEPDELFDQLSARGVDLNKSRWQRIYDYVDHHNGRPPGNDEDEDIKSDVGLGRRIIYNVIGGIANALKADEYEDYYIH